MLEKNKERLAKIESINNGKPIRETVAIYITTGIEHPRYFDACIMSEECSATCLDGKYLSFILRKPILV